MSRNKPDYTKFMRKPPPLEPRPKPVTEAPPHPLEDEIPWAEIVPIQEGEIAFTGPGQIAYFELVDSAPERPAPPEAPPADVPEEAPPVEALPLQIPDPPEPAPAPPIESAQPAETAAQPELVPVVFYETVPPAPILACGLFLVILAFIAS